MPAPPPPPPPADFPKSEKLKNTVHKITPQDLDKMIERQLLFDQSLKVFYKTNYYLTPQLQEGPKCGLVALSIASSISENVGVDYILEKARSKNFTKKGEIFDAEYLAIVAEELCGFTATVIEGGLHKHMNCIINNLLNKNLILIPYDADHNHSPCLKQGFKAHWAVITGFVIFTSSETSETEAATPEEYNFVSINSHNYPLCDCLVTSNVHLNVSQTEGNILLEKKKLNNNNCRKNINGKIFLIGLQGKSKYLGFWEMDDMANSNDNLLYFSPDRDADDYVLPEGGPATGLKGKAIILRSASAELI